MTTVKHQQSCDNGKCSHNPIRMEGDTYVCCDCRCHAVEGVITGSCGKNEHNKCSGFVFGRNNGPAGDIVPCTCECHVADC